MYYTKEQSAKLIKLGLPEVLADGAEYVDEDGQTVRVDDCYERVGGAPLFSTTCLLDELQGTGYRLRIDYRPVQFGDVWWLRCGPRMTTSPNFATAVYDMTCKLLNEGLLYKNYEN